MKSKKEEKEDTDGEIIHKVLLKNTFLNLLQLLKMLKSKQELKDGLLTISMERIIPEHKKQELLILNSF